MSFLLQQSLPDFTGDVVGGSKLKTEFTGGLSTPIGTPTPTVAKSSDDDEDSTPMGAFGTLSTTGTFQRAETPSGKPNLGFTFGFKRQF